MASTSLKPDEYLKQVLSDLPNSIEKEQAMSLSTSPLLAAYYAWLRKINGLHNKTDIDVENKQFVSDFIYLCNHNLIFCLTVMGRFDLLRELFQAVTPTKDELYLIELIKREHQILKNNEMQTTPKAPIYNASQYQDDHWAQYVVALSNVHMMHFYQEEIKRVHYEHQVQQAELYSQAFEARLGRIEFALNLIENDDQFSPEVKAQFRELVNRSHADYEFVLAAHQESEKNPLDLHTIQLKREAAEQMYIRSNELFNYLKLLAKTHPHKKELVDVVKTDNKENGEVKKNAERNEQLYKQQLKDFVQLSHRFTQQVKKEQIKQLDQIQKIAKNCPKERLNPVQQQHMERVIEHIKDLRSKVNTVVRFEDLQSALKEWYQQLNSLEHLFNATQSTPVIQEFTEAVKDIRSVIAEAGQLKSAYNNSTTHTQVQPYPPKVGFFTHTEVTPQGPAADEKEVADSRVFKLRKQEVTQGEDVLELDEEMRNELIKALEDLRNNLGNLTDNDELTENDLKLAHEIESVILKKFESTDSNRVSASSISALNTALDKFEQSPDSFKTLKTTLSKIIDSFESQFNPTNQAHI